MIVLSFLVYAGALLPRPAHADWAMKAAAMNCDPANNRALIRFDVVEDSHDNHFVTGARLAGMLYISYGNLPNMNFGNSCRLSDGRTLTLSYSEGQSFPYGMGGADPDGFFTLDVDGKKIFYKAEWYRGYGYDHPFLHSLVILDQSRVLYCDGPADEKSQLADFHVKPKDCHDVSERLKGVLPEDEKKKQDTDIAHEKYQPIVVDRDVCDHLGNVSPDEFPQGASRLHGDKAQPSGPIYKMDLDIRNAGERQSVYWLYGRNHAFDGSMVFYFTNKDSEKDFLGWYAGRNEKNLLTGSGLDFVSDAEERWPGLHLVSAKSLNKSDGAEYRLNYTNIVPVTYKNQTYLRFTALNKNTFPPVIVARLDRQNNLRTICTFKNYRNHR